MYCTGHANTTIVQVLQTLVGAGPGEGQTPAAMTRYSSWKIFRWGGVRGPQNFWGLITRDHTKHLRRSDCALSDMREPEPCRVIHLRLADYWYMYFQEITVWVTNNLRILASGWLKPSAGVLCCLVAVLCTLSSVLTSHYCYKHMRLNGRRRETSFQEGAFPPERRTF